MELGFKHVGFDDVDDLLALCGLERKEGTPTGVPVADEAPVKARQEVEDVNESGQEVDETHPSEPVLLIGLSGVEGANGRPDEVAGDAEKHQGHRIDPVVDAHREFPHVHAPVLDRLIAIRLKCVLYANAMGTHSPHSKETW